MIRNVIRGKSEATVRIFGQWVSAAVLLALGFAANAEQVVRVKDGDSIVIASAGNQVDVRLADIDAPEFRQERGPEARDALHNLVAGKEIQLQLIGGDAYRRIIAHVFIDGVHVNAEMVGRGLAWVRRAYDPPAHLVQREDEARAARRGLWADADPTPPWDWRKAKRSSRSTIPVGAAQQASSQREALAQLTVPRVQCGSKRYCREMSSCAEAVAFLRQCGVDTIDGDDDGMPCETKCRLELGLRR